MFGKRFPAFVMANVASFSLGYLFLSGYYAPMLNWLAPYYGSRLYFAFAFFFMILGNPITYPVLLVTWMIVGVVIGLFTRKVLRSIGVTISLFTFLSAEIVATVALIFLSSFNFLSPSSLSSGSFASISSFPVTGAPQGTNIASILGEPVFMNIISAFLSVLSSIRITPGASPTSFLNFTTLFPFILKIILGTVISFVTCATTASLVSYFIRKVSGGPRKALPSPSASKAPAPPAVFIVLLVVVIVLIGSGGLLALHQPANNSSNASTVPFLSLSQPTQEKLLTSAFSTAMVSHYGALGNLVRESLAKGTGTSNYTEMGLNVVSPYGTHYSMYVMSGGGTVPESATYGFDQVEFSILMLSYNLGAFLEGLGLSPKIMGNSSIGGTFSSLSNLIPPEILIVSVHNGSKAEDSVANAQAQYYSSVTGSTLFPLFNSTAISSLASSFVNRNGSGTSFLPTSLGNFYIYLGISNMDSISQHFSSSYLAEFHRGGIMNLLANGLGGGYLLNSGLPSMNSAIIMTGFVNESDLGSLAPRGYQNVSILRASGTVPFVFGLFRQPVFDYGNGVHTLSLMDLTGYSGQFNFSSTSSFSSLFVLYPTANSGFSYSSLSASYGGTVFSSNTTTTGPISSGNWTVQAVNSGFKFSPTYSISYNASLPPKIVFNRAISQSGSSYKMTETVTNDGSTPVSGVRLLQPGNTFEQGVLTFTKHKSVSASVHTLGPGSSISLVYYFNQSNPGIMVIPAPSVSFNSSSMHYSVPYSPAYISISQPPLYTATVGYFAFQFYVALSRVTSISYFEAELLSILFLTVAVGWSLYSEARAFRMWKHGPKQAPPPKR